MNISIYMDYVPITILIRLLYYLPMEMGNLMNASLKALLNEQYKLVAELREENKNLKEYNGELIENHKKDIAILCEENEKLKGIIENTSIEQNADRKHIEQLEEENKKLKSDLAFERTMLDNVRAEYKSLQNVIKNLKAELSKNKVERWSLKKDCENKIEQQKIALKSMENQIRELKETLDHRDSFFSIMRDVLANEEIDNTQLAAILYCVVHEECGDYDLSEKELKIAKEFWGRKYV